MRGWFKSSRKALRTTLFLAGGLLLLSQYQNCGQYQALPGQSSSAASLSAEMTSCRFNGLVWPSEMVVTAYQTSNGACLSEERRCLDGALSGSFAFASCAPNGQPSCLFNGMQILSGASIDAYLNPTTTGDQVCVKQTRTCTSGTLSGSYAFARCSSDAATAPGASAPAPTVPGGAVVQRDCIFNQAQILNQETVLAFRSSTVAAGRTCDRETRTCNDGTLSGSFAFPSCAPAQKKSCLFNGGQLASGQTVVAFQNSNARPGQKCVSETRACDDGTLSGAFSFANCEVAKPQSCTFDGRQVAHGETVTGYPRSTIPAGGACVGVRMTCNNANLPGSAQNTFATCNVAAPAQCTFNGGGVADGGTVLAYATSTAAFGGSCRSESRVCRDGQLSGSNAFATCAVNQAASCVWNGQTFSHGQQVNRYRSATDAACTPSAATCDNGNLSGSGDFASCQIPPPPARPCSVVVSNDNGTGVNDISVEPGASVTLYPRRTAGIGVNSCDPQTYTCVANRIGTPGFLFAQCDLLRPIYVARRGGWNKIGMGQTRTDYLDTQSFGEGGSAYEWSAPPTRGSPEMWGHYLLYAGAGAGRIPLYRCVTNGGHITTTDANCEGGKMDGALGYLASAPSETTYRIVSCIDYFGGVITSNQVDCNLGGGQSAFRRSLGYAPKQLGD